jgi:hypothetical protein
LDGLVEAELPTFAVVNAADELDALVRVHAVGLVDALDLDVVCHWLVVFGCENPSMSAAGGKLLHRRHPRVTIQFFTLIVALERPRFKKARIAVRSGSGSF